MKAPTFDQFTLAIDWLRECDEPSHTEGCKAVVDFLSKIRRERENNALASKLARKLGVSVKKIRQTDTFRRLTSETN